MLLTQKLIADFMRLAEQEIPAKPGIPPEHVRILRLRLIAEELLELANAFSCHLIADNGRNPSVTVRPIMDDPTILENQRLLLAADGVADLMYVVEGTGCAMGLDLEPIFLEVDAANKTKFIGGHKDNFGKWIKGPSTRPPNLGPIIDSQIISADAASAQTRLNLSLSQS